MNLKQYFKDEPEFNWDLIIPYESLLFDAPWVVKQVFEKFGIELDPTSLDQYYKDYVKYTFNSKT